MSKKSKNRSYLKDDFEKKTRRLIIRFLNINDYEKWRDANLNITVKLSRWDKGPKDAKKLTKREYNRKLNIEKCARNGDFSYYFAVFLKNSGELIGDCCVMDISRKNNLSGEIGYGLFNSFWGKGYASEYVKALIDISFKNLKLHRVEAMMDIDNFRSVKLVKNIGMRKEGHMKRFIKYDNIWHDILRYALTVED